MLPISYLFVKSLEIDIFLINSTKWALYFLKGAEWITRCDQSILEKKSWANQTISLKSIN